MIKKVLQLRERTFKELTIHQHNIKYLDYVINILNKEFIIDTNEIERTILLIYIKTGSIQKTKTEINENLKYRIKTTSKQGERKYTTIDISNLLQSEISSDNHEFNEILEAAKIIYWYSGQSNYGNLVVADSKMDENWIKRI